MGGVLKSVTGALFGDSGSGSSPATTTTSSSDIPLWMSKAGMDIYDQGKAAVANYQSPAFNSNLQSAYDTAANSQNYYQPYSTKALENLNATQTDWNTAAQNQYMNPYTSSVLTGTLKNLQDVYDQSARARAAKAVQSGAYGGAREGVQNELAQKDYAQQTTDTSNKILSDAYNTAYANWSADQAKKMALANAYNTSGTALGTSIGQNLTNLTNTGNLKYNYDTAKANEAKNNAQYLASLVATSPYSKSGVATTSTAKQDNGIMGDVSQLAGLAGSIYMMSDKRLKKNIRLIRTIKDINIYEFEYNKDWLPQGKFIGVMAQEIKNRINNAVLRVKNGYYAVNYDLVNKYLGV